MKVKKLVLLVGLIVGSTTYIPSSSKEKFFDIIEEYIHPSMKYKLGESRQ